MTRTGGHTGRARGPTTLGRLGATPLVGTTTAATSRPPRGTKTTPGPTGLAAIRDDEKFVMQQYLNSELSTFNEIHVHVLIYLSEFELSGAQTICITGFEYWF